MKVLLSISLVAASLISCQSAQGPNFEAGMMRISGSGDLMSSTDYTDNTGTQSTPDTWEVSDTSFDLAGGYFFSPDVELGGHVRTSSNEVTGTNGDKTLAEGTGFGLYGRYYFSHSGVHHWAQVGMNSDSSETTTTPFGATATSTTANGSSMDIGVGLTHFITESAALEVGVFSRTGTLDTWDTSMMDVTWGFSYFF